MGEEGTLVVTDGHINKWTVGAASKQCLLMLQTLTLNSLNRDANERPLLSFKAK